MTDTAQAQTTKNPWLIHVKAYADAHPDLKYKDALLGARDTYKKQEAKEKVGDGEKKVNPWMEHIDRWKEANPNWKESVTYKEVVRTCKETYHTEVSV